MLHDSPELICVPQVVVLDCTFTFCSILGSIVHGSAVHSTSGMSPRKHDIAPVLDLIVLAENLQPLGHVVALPMT